MKNSYQLTLTPVTMLAVLLLVQVVVKVTSFSLIHLHSPRYGTASSINRYQNHYLSYHQDLQVLQAAAAAAAGEGDSSNRPTTIPDDVQIVSAMPDPLPSDLKNQYYLLRHGQSTANVASIISSSRSLAYSTKHGLTALGKEQGQQAATQLVNVLEQEIQQREGDDNKQQIIFISSPFARAHQTAEACLKELQNQNDLQTRIDKLGLELYPEIVLNEKLMERYFGRLDNEAIYTYAYVWPVDKFDVTHTAFDVESVAAVCTRLRALIVDELESTYQNCHLVLTSHADVLQIAQLYAAGAENVGTFSSYRFGNGEVRPMKRTVDSLPDPIDLEAPQRGTQV